MTMKDYAETAERIVKRVRAYTTTVDEAIALVTQALRAAHSKGALEGTLDDEGFPK